MAAKVKNPKFDIRQLDVAFSRADLGGLLKSVREQSGLSLREVQALSGIKNSEISKIEHGQQDCRLETFFKLVTALGLNPGHVLDDLITTTFFQFQLALQSDAEFEAWCRRHNKWPYPSGFFDVPLVTQVASYASVAAQIVRCSDPVRLAVRLQYPDESTRLAFVRFAEKLTGVVRPRERQAMLRSLQTRPFGALKELGVFVEESLSQFAFLANEAYKSYLEDPEHKTRKSVLPTRSRHGVPFWFPWLQLISDAKKVDTAAGSNYEAGTVMKNLWTPWMKRLEKVCAQDGAKARCAREVNVSRQLVAKWLEGTEPTADFALRLILWIEKEEKAAPET